MDTIKINKHNTLLISDGGNQINEIDHTYPAILGACNKDLFLEHTIYLSLVNLTYTKIPS